MQDTTDLDSNFNSVIDYRAHGTIPSTAYYKYGKNKLNYNGVEPTQQHTKSKE
jgi:hypothetical protein